MVSAVTARTLFSEPSFVAAVTSSGHDGLRPHPVLVAGSPRVTAIARPVGAGLRHMYLGPFGLYGAPHDTCDALDILDALERAPALSLRWNVRFDHGDLAAVLRSRHPAVASPTHVLELRADYEQVFGAFSTTRRRQVRIALKAGVSVRVARTDADLAEYLRVHRDLSVRKDRALDYPPSMFRALMQLPTCQLLLAEQAQRVVAGAMFFRDGDSFMYWHGASDRAASAAFPTCAIFDHAIRHAVAERLATVNFGASLGVSSLEEFKASWGARPRDGWKFQWGHPAWRVAQRVRRLSRSVGSVLSRYRRAR